MNKRNIIKLIAVLLFLALLGAGAGITVYLLSDRKESPRETLVQGFGTYKRVEYGPNTYVRKNGITTALLIGVDRADDSRRKGYRDGGQADFLLLTVIDDNERTVRLLHIDRDTLANITILGVLGQEVGTRYTQICLSHGFGATEEQNCSYTVKAVSNLLEGEQIDLYLSCDMDSIADINDLIGGVSVTLTEDFTSRDPAMIKGATVTLEGKQAEYFVRSRYSIADGTNEKRMERQRVYLNAAKDAIIVRAKADSGFANSFLNSIWDRITSDAGLGRVINLFSNAVSYQILPIDTLPGVHMIGSDGFVEYRTEDNAAVEWVLNNLYKLES